MARPSPTRRSRVARRQRRRVTCAAAAVVTLCGAASAAHAHLLGVGGLLPFVDDGALVGGSTTWGLVGVDADGTARRVCEEAAGPGPTQYLRLASGRVLIGTPAGVAYTDDGGCTLHSVGPPLSGVVVTAMATGAFGTFVTTGRAGYPNGVFVSDDGAAFTATALAGSASPLYSVAVEPAGGRIVVAGDDLDIEAAMVFESSDGGASWTRNAFAVDAWVGLRISGFAANGDALLAGTRTDGTGDVLIAPAGLLTATVVGPLPGPVTHVAEHDGELYAVVSPGALYARASGAAAFSSTGVDAECVVSAGDALWACGSTTGPLAGVHFAVLQDGAWFPALRDAAIAQRICPVETVGHTACAAYFGTDAGPDAADAGAPTNDAGGDAADAGAKADGGLDAGRASDAGSAFDAGADSGNDDDTHHDGGDAPAPAGCHHTQPARGSLTAAVLCAAMIMGAARRRTKACCRPCA